MRRRRVDRRLRRDRGGRGDASAAGAGAGGGGGAGVVGCARLPPGTGSPRVPRAASVPGPRARASRPRATSPRGRAQPRPSARALPPAAFAGGAVRDRGLRARAFGRAGGAGSGVAMARRRGDSLRSRRDLLDERCLGDRLLHPPASPRRRPSRRRARRPLPPRARPSRRRARPASATGSDSSSATAPRRRDPARRRLRRWAGPPARRSPRPSGIRWRALRQPGGSVATGLAAGCRLRGRRLGGPVWVVSAFAASTAFGRSSAGARRRCWLVGRLGRDLGVGRRGLGGRFRGGRDLGDLRPDGLRRSS